MSKPRVFLERFAYVKGMGTFGTMTISSLPFSCFTVEQDWEDNKPELSCIPEGHYTLVRGRYNQGGYETFELRNVPGRSLIKIHRGNTMDDLLGCIAPGKKLGFMHGKWAVVGSTAAFAEFMAALDGVDETIIVISSVFHVGCTGILV